MRKSESRFLFPLIVITVVLFNVFFGYLYEIKYRDVPVIVYVLIWLVNASALCGVTLYKDRLEFSSVGLWKLILLTVCVRLIYLWQRLQLGKMIVDGDIALFYNYAKKFVGGSYPYMEYPQFALLLFSLGYFLSGEQLVNFRIIFPLMQLPFEALIVTCLYKIGAKFSNIQTATILSIFYAVFPFNMIFWFAKYDVIPTALFLLGLYWIITGCYVFSAMAMVLGFLTKWYPILLFPFAIAYLLRNYKLDEMVKYVFSALSMSAGVLIPFAWLNIDKFLYAYKFHATRGLTGNSFFFILVYYLTPFGKPLDEMKPWQGRIADPQILSIILSFQILAILILLAYLTLCPTIQNLVVNSALAVILFAMLNKVYQPQYLLWMLTGFICCSLTAQNQKTFITALTIALLTVLPLASFLIWPRYIPAWLTCSILFYATCWFLVGFYLLKTGRRSLRGV